MRKDSMQNDSMDNNYAYPSQLQDAAESMASLTKLLLEVQNTLINLRREFRGEALYQAQDGSNHWIQVTKPLFLKVDFKTGQPIKENKKMPWGEERNVYLANDEAIEEVISMLKFAGVNQVTAIASVNEENYMDDLMEFELKLPEVLALKQKEWGIDKELLPMLQFKIKTMVQDARSLAFQGRTLKALQTSVQRVEQMIEGTDPRKQKNYNPF